MGVIAFPQRQKPLVAVEELHIPLLVIEKYFLDHGMFSLDENRSFNSVWYGFTPEQRVFYTHLVAGLAR